MTSASLIIAVYNKPEPLRYIFEALLRQSVRDFEVIIADDGSGKAMADVVNDFKRRAPFRIKHLWHADDGWRKNTMLNDAIRESGTDYLIFIDGDCIPGRHFIEDHLNHRERRTVLLGRRVEHSERWARALSLERIASGSFERYSAMDLLDATRGKALTLEAGFRITNPIVRKMTGEVTTILGCNFSTYKEHLIEVNGFDEGYRGPGCGEDSDIFFRLNLVGVRGKSLRNLAIQYHFYHPLTEPNRACVERFLQVQQQHNAQCADGLVKLSRRRMFTE